MQALDDWFLDWLADHRTLHARVRLPDDLTQEGEVIFRAWVREFRALGVTRAEADEASERLYALAHHEDRHFLTLLEVIRAMRAGRAQAVVEDPEVTARRDSRTCPECEGIGLAVRYRQKTIAPPLLLYCVCPLGRHLLRTGRGPDGCRDLAEFAWLRGEKGLRYRLPPAPLRLHRPAEATGDSEFSAWWKTGKPEPNVPEAAVS